MCECACPCPCPCTRARARLHVLLRVSVRLRVYVRVRMRMSVHEELQRSGDPRFAPAARTNCPAEVVKPQCVVLTPRPEPQPHEPPSVSGGRPADRHYTSKHGVIDEVASRRDHMSPQCDAPRGHDARQLGRHREAGCRPRPADAVILRRVHHLLLLDDDIDPHRRRVGQHDRGLLAPLGRVDRRLLAWRARCACEERLHGWAHCRA